MDELNRKISSLRNLKQYKDLNDEEVKIKAQELLDKENILINLAFCVDDEEKNYAKNLLDRYLSESSIESEADKDTLRHLVDLEILAERIKKYLKTEYNKSNPSIPIQMMEQLHETETQILEFKEKLGLTSKDRTQSNLVETLNILKKKAIKYYEEHRGCNIVKCPYCQKLIMLLMRTEHLEAKEAKMFKGTLLYNKPLIELYHKKILTKEKVAEILGVSDFYIDFIYENIYLKEEENVS